MLGGLPWKDEQGRCHAKAFARAGKCYWQEIFPLVREEGRAWRGRAEAIPDPSLRREAIFTQTTKWGHSEGAAAFAVLVPSEQRQSMVRMAIAYELMIDYLDTVSERPVSDVFANTLQLHRALDVALGGPVADGEFYALHSHRDDGGYLDALVATCREAALALPSFAAVADAARRSATLYAESQALHHAGLDETSDPELAPVATTRAEAIRNPDLTWWELIAAGGSSLPVLALMAASTEPGVTGQQAEQIRTAYYPLACALHISLDGLVDWSADRASGAPNQIDHYDSPDVAAARLALLASRARQSLSRLPRGEMHEVILSGLGGYYLAPRHIWKQESGTIAGEVFGAMGPMIRPAWVVHRLRQVARSPVRENSPLAPA